MNDEVLNDATTAHKALWAVVKAAKLALADMDRATIYNGSTTPFDALREAVEAAEKFQR